MKNDRSLMFRMPENLFQVLENYASELHVSKSEFMRGMLRTLASNKAIEPEDFAKEIKADIVSTKEPPNIEGHIVSTRVPLGHHDIISSYADTKNTSVSAIVRALIRAFAEGKTTISSNLPVRQHVRKQTNPDSEGVYRSQSKWANAVKSRDNYCCVECGDQGPVVAHHIIFIESGGEHTLENGMTLCHPCHSKKHTVDDYIGIDVPNAWKTRERNYKGNHGGETEAFWKEQLARLNTRRCIKWTRITKRYINTFLQDIPEHVVKRTVITLCPDPRAIKQKPVESFIPYKEELTPPTLIWLEGEQDASTKEESINT